VEHNRDPGTGVVRSFHPRDPNRALRVEGVEEPFFVGRTVESEGDESVLLLALLHPSSFREAVRSDGRVRRLVFDMRTEMLEGGVTSTRSPRDLRQWWERR